MVQFLAIVALGLFTGWMFQQWVGLFDSLYVAAAVWISAFLLYAFIYDRRQAQKRRSRQSFREGEQSGPNCGL